MISISLCIIVKDEEEVITRCLESIKDSVDEIIIVDTGSTDETKNIVRKYTDKVFDFDWIDDFSEARNFSFSKATKDYILWLDADEFIDNENKTKLLALKSEITDEIDIISMQTWLCMENNNPEVILKRNRLVKRSKNYKWIGVIHEYIDACGNCYDSDIKIIHNKVKSINNRNLEIYRNIIKSGKLLNDRDLYYYGKELYYNKLIDEAIEILETFTHKEAYEEEIVDALCKIGECYLYKGLPMKAREYLYKTFEYIEPRGEILYDLANSFEIEKKYIQAIRWYEIILDLPLPNNCNQCINFSCWRLKPHLNLCSCYYEIDNLQKSYYHHLKCLEINPNNPCVVENDKYFKSIIRKT